MGTSQKMKLFALFLFFSLVTAGQKNNQKRQKRKLSRKEFRKCKSENCIRSLCPRASDNYSCISAERDNKYFFCSNAENCTGPHSGAIPVSDKSCPSGSFCCSWGE